jgi:hypothetical protein
VEESTGFIEQLDVVSETFAIKMAKVFLHLKTIFGRMI